MTPEVAAALAEMGRTFDDELALTRAHWSALPDSPERVRMLDHLAPHTGGMDTTARDLRDRVRDGYVTPGQAAGYWSSMIEGLRKLRKPVEAPPVQTPTREKDKPRVTLSELEAIRRRLAERDEPHGYDALRRAAMVARSTVQDRYKDEQRPPGAPIPGVCDLKGSTHQH